MLKVKNIHRALIIAILIIAPIGAFNAPAQAENCGWAMVDVDGKSLGVSVGDCAGNFWREWQALGIIDGTFINAGCKMPCRYVIQTREDPLTGNVVGYNGSAGGISVQYDGKTNSFSVSNSTPTSNSSNPNVATPPPTITLIIKDGVATDTSGRSYDVGSGLSTSTTLSQAQFQQLVTETSRIDNAKNQRQIALEKARSLAIQTPGLERCVSWSGYLENGQECATATSSDSATVQTKSASNSLSNSDSQTVLNFGTESSTVSSDSVTVNVKPLNNYAAPKINSESVEIEGSASKVSSLALKIETNLKTGTDIDKSLRKLESLRTITASSSIKLPDSKLTKESVASLTPEVCSVAGIQISRSSKGTCKVSYTLTSEAGNTYTTEKTFTFR
jgi:hypothetical protein